MGATCLTLPSCPPDLGSFCRRDELGLQVAGQRLEPGRAVLACRVVETDEFARWCRRCGCEAAPRDSVTRRLAHEPLGWRPMTLLITIRRYRCTGCGHVSRQDTSRATEPRAKLSRRALRWALEGIVCQHLTVARVAEGLGVSWNTANDAVLAEGRRVLIEDPHRFDGVRVIGVDERCWRHTRRGRNSYRFTDNAVLTRRAPQGRTRALPARPTRVKRWTEPYQASRAPRPHLEQPDHGHRPRSRNHVRGFGFSADGYLLGTYRMATAPDPNSSRLTSFKSTGFESPANNVGPWPASLGCTTNSYSSINPNSAN